MRVLIACEKSGRVRDAFIALGHDAISCDTQPSETPGPHHRGDIITSGLLLVSDVAQWLERVEVAGSNPAITTKIPASIGYALRTGERSGTLQIIAGSIAPL